MNAARQDFDDDHGPAAAGAAAPWLQADLACWCFLHGRLEHAEQLADMGDIVLAGGAGEQPVMTDTVEAPGQHVEQEAADEFRRC